MTGIALKCMSSLLAAAFVAAEEGEELRLFQTTEEKGFREIATRLARQEFDEIRQPHRGVAHFLELGGAFDEILETGLCEFIP